MDPQIALLGAGGFGMMAQREEIEKQLRGDDR
jgi:hypothetical protein